MNLQKENQNHLEPLVELEVLTGPQKGASAALNPVGSTTVGTGLGNDIVLQHGFSDANRMRIQASDTGFLLETEEGEIRLGDAVVQQGESMPVLPGTEITLGQTTFALVARQSDSIGINVTDSVKPAALAQSSAVDESFPVAQEQSHAIIANGTASAKRFVSFVGVAVLAFGLIAYSFMGSNTQSIPGAEKPSLASLLDTPEFVHVKVQTNSSGVVTLGGYVASQDIKRSLEDTLRHHETAAIVRPFVSSDIQSSIVDLYRIHGISVEISSESPGFFLVRATAPDDERLSTATAAILKDIPGINDIAVDNQALPVEVVDAYEEDPGKRVVLVVAGDPAYVVTQDKSRYFVGSSLPTGHLIKNIYAETVVLDRGGVETELKF